MPSLAAGVVRGDYVHSNEQGKWLRLGLEDHEMQNWAEDEQQLAKRATARKAKGQVSWADMVRPPEWESSAHQSGRQITSHYEAAKEARRAQRVQQQQQNASTLSSARRGYGPRKSLEEAAAAPGQQRLQWPRRRCPSVSN